MKTDPKRKIFLCCVNSNTVTKLWIIFILLCVLQGTILQLGYHNNDEKSFEFSSKSIVEQLKRSREVDVVTSDAQRVSTDLNEITMLNTNESLRPTRILIEGVKNEFYDRYGGKEDALKLLSKGVISLGGLENDNRDIKHIASRILHSKQADKEFIMAYGGYSVTVGRGNYFEQSFPFIVEKILSPVFNALGIKLVVRNAAIGGIPSFPYGWCLSNYLGEDVDVISWDFSMNEGKSSSGLEAYIRNSMMLNKSSGRATPMIIMLDQNRDRRNLLKQYADLGFLFDPIAVGKGEVAEKKYLELKNDSRPAGYKNWEEWGAPKGSPGQSSWHPKYMEHEMIGWMIAMHFLKGLEHAVELMEMDEKARREDSMQLNQKLFLPKPMHEATSSLLFGVPLDQTSWTMNKLACRTNFKPTIKGPITEIVVSGLSPFANNSEDVLNERKNEDYEHGWLLDVGFLEKKTKLTVMKFGGLGYIDMKIAIYGTMSSGSLHLFLPYENENALEQSMMTQSTDNPLIKEANEFIPNIILCEVNEKRGDRECNFEKDLIILVNGVKVEAIKVPEASYLKKNICREIHVPSGIKLSKRNKVEGQQNQFVDGVYDLGLDVLISVNNDEVNHSDGACSIANVIWENIPKSTFVP